MTGAEAFLAALRAAGVDWVFGNPGTDFPPVIEALARAPATRRDAARRSRCRTRTSRSAWRTATTS